MTDDAFWERLIGNIQNQISELDKHEAEVVLRPNSDGKTKQLEAIKINRDKLVDLAKSAALSASRNK